MFPTRDCIYFAATTIYNIRVAIFLNAASFLNLTSFGSRLYFTTDTVRLADMALERASDILGDSLYLRLC